MCANCTYVCTNYGGTVTCHLYLYMYKTNKLYISFQSFTVRTGIRTSSLMVLDNLHRCFSRTRTCIFRTEGTASRQMTGRCNIYMDTTLLTMKMLSAYFSEMSQSKKLSCVAVYNAITCSNTLSLAQRVEVATFIL